MEHGETMHGKFFVSVDELRELFRRGLVPGSEGMTETEIEAKVAELVRTVGVRVGDVAQQN
jgi:hypothetical protein